jgi:dTDP-glucose 4,6-dehydratase
LVNKNIIVTGGYGFIGSCLVKELLKDENVSVCNIDKLTYSSNIDSIDKSCKNFSFIKGDISDTELLRSIFSDFQPDAIFNLAAETHVDRSIDNPYTFIKSNINGTFSLLYEGYNYWKLLPKDKKLNFKFIQISTDEVYGTLTKNDDPFDEDSLYRPNSPYSASKASADHLVRSWFKTYSFPSIITNTCNNYGPWQFPEKLIPLIISKCLKNEKIPVYGDGNQIRDWIRVEDNVSGLLKVLECGMIGEKYNIGANCELKNIDVVNDICTILDRLIPNINYSYTKLIDFVDDRPGHDYRYAINNSKIKKLGWSQKYSWENGILETVKWYLDNKKFLLSNKKSGYSGERLGKL